MTGRLKGKVCVVTGASSGVGRATALMFAREGAQVVAAARRMKELEELCAVAAAEGGEIVASRTDVTREQEVRAMIDLAMDRFGQVDVGVNAAGGTFGGGLTHQLEESQFREWIDGYLVSAFLCTKHELRGMLERRNGSPPRGSIINVGTFAGYTKTFPGTVGYASAKTGLIGLTRTVANEYAARDIRANLLIVGGVDTPMFGLWNDTKEKRSWAEQLHAMKRISQPDEIARTALFLASDDSSFVTGTTLTVDGGLSLV
jgi:NAD(P)-dependent dehydrogenase (short-subunit alcohol dehydrogenase family)